MRLQPEVQELQRMVRVALGQEPPDLYITGGQLLNVYTGEVLPANVAVAGGRIAYAGPEELAPGPQTMVLDAWGKYLVPGYIDPHTHPDFLYNPVSFAWENLRRGVTTMVADSYYTYVLLGPQRFARFVRDLQDLPLKYFWNLRLFPESPWGRESEFYSPASWEPLLDLPRVTGLDELTRWTGILDGDQRTLAGMLACRQRGKRPDGHTAGAGGKKLQALAAAGISGCHESIDAGQALERLRTGMYVALRNSSHRPEDLAAMLKGISRQGLSASRLMLTADGPAPHYTAGHGHVEGLVRIALGAGVPPAEAYAMASLNPAAYFHLDDQVGGIAPGRLADILLLDSLAEPFPQAVIASGRLVAQEGEMLLPEPEVRWADYGLCPFAFPPGWRATPDIFRVPAGQGGTFPVLDLVNPAITRRRDMELPREGDFLVPARDSGVLYLSLLDRDARWISTGFIAGLAPRLDGLASTFTCAPETVLAAGRNRASMALAVNRLQEIGGGIVVVDEDRVVAEMRLPLGGHMSERPFAGLLQEVGELNKAVEERGYAYSDFFHTIFFLCSDFLPWLRLTAHGVYSVTERQVLVPVREL